MEHFFCRFPPPEARPPSPGERRPPDSLIFRQVDPHLAAPAPISRIVFAARRLRLPIRHRQGSNPQPHRSEQPPRQMTLRQQQPVVARGLNQTTAGLHQPLLQARQRPLLDPLGQHQSPPQVAQIIGNEGQAQPDLVGPELVAAEPPDSRLPD